MPLIRPLLLVLLVAAAAGGAAYWRWPELEPALGAAFGGLLLLHLYALARLARLERRLADRAIPAPRKNRKDPETSRTSPSASVGSRSEAKSAASGLAPGRVVTPISAAEPTPSEEPERVEDFLRVVLDDPDAEEVSFLPPYASDEAEEVSFIEPYGPGEEQGPPLDDAPAVALETATGDSEGEEHMGDLGDEGEVSAAGPERSADDPETPERYRNVPIPRHFALGTVAIIKNVLTPAEVAQVLVEQRKRPRERFGEIAVELGLLTGSELEGLLLAQQQGLFTDEEIREARGRIKAFRELEATASAE